VRAVPLAVGGALHGVINVEVPAGLPAERPGDGQVLAQLATTAALGVRNLRGIEELASLKGYLEDLIEHANALIAVVDRAGAVTVWNGALTRLTGVSRGEALGRPLAGFLAPEEAEEAAALVARSLAGEAVDGHELTLAVVGGAEALAAFNTAPIRGGGGEVVGVIAIGQDLTRLHSLEAAAEQAEKMAGLGRLAAGIVHELNNPLTAVTMYAEALYEKWALGGGAAADVEKLKAIKDAGQRILKLARDLTTYARPSAARPEPVDLATLLDQAALMCKPALKEADARVERAFEPVPQVVGARAALVQAFVNVIANGAQALGRGGLLTLTLSAAGGRVLATVGDDGAGMAPEVLARAFEPFFTTRSGKGIGLGLPIARGIVERHGGSITIHSEPGRGTTVIVSLPGKPG
jgi:PAS domain S-box-containing protein